MKKYLYLTTQSVQDRPLIEAESQQFLQTQPDSDGIILSNQRADLQHAAYLRSGMELLYEGDSLEQLMHYLDHAGLHREGFRVSVVKRGDTDSLESMSIAHEVGARIGGHPNLSAPSCVFQVVFADQRVWFGKVDTEADNLWNKHAKKPVMTSSSLPVRLARLMVNLGGGPGTRLVDPCCGTGTILIEAATVGMEVTGHDISRKLVQGSQQNLAHFSLAAEVSVADATTLTGDFDAVVTDLPYGRMLPVSNQLYEDILSNLRHLAPRHVIVTAMDLTPYLDRLGYRLKAQIRAPKYRFVRLIHVMDDG